MLWVPVPTAVGVYVTEQLLVLDVAGDRVQLVAGVNPPAPVVVKLTLPVGLDLVPLAVSGSVARRVGTGLTATDAGEQLVLVDVERVVTATLKPVASAEFAKIVVAV